MGIIDEIAKARHAEVQKVSVSAVRKGLRVALRQERERVHGLNNEALELALIDDTVLVLPVKGETYLEQDIEVAIVDALKQYNPRRIEVLGYVAYELDQKPDLSSVIIPTTLSLNYVDVNGALAPQKHAVQRRSRSPTVIPADAYMPKQEKGDRFCIPLPNETCFDYKLISLSKDDRPLFPGYRVPFTISDGDTDISTYVTSAIKGTPVGAMKGSYITRNIGLIYDAHPELRTTREMRFEVIEPGKEYRLLS